MNEENFSEMEDELRPEYDLNQLLRGGVRGKYAQRYGQGANVVVLDPDVARAFPNEEVVNRALRLVMQIADIPMRSREEKTSDALQAALFETQSDYETAHEQDT